MKKILIGILAMVCTCVLMFNPAHIEAFLTAQDDGTVYDDYLNIYWLANANLAESEDFGIAGINPNGSMNWNTANEWITAMNLHNGTGYLGYNNWRLPSPLNTDGTGPCTGPTCVDSEMAHLFFSDLGGTANDGSGTRNKVTDSGDPDLDKFTNILSFYWSGMEFDSFNAYDFDFWGYVQGVNPKSDGHFVWPVRDAAPIPEDTTPPQLVEFDFDPKSIDVSSGPQDVTFTMRITDDLSGFNNGWLLIASPSGQQSLTETISVNKLISGDTLDGIYEFPMTFPQFSETGLWCVTSMFLKDDTNNMGRPDLSLLECVEVISTTQDTNPPELVQFSFTPTTVDVGSGPQTATFTLRITDDLSGFNNGWLLIASPSGQQSLTETISVNKLISGDTLDGIYEFPMTFPQFSETGLWCVTSMFLKDDTNNMGRPDLSLLECVEVISTTQDTNPPELVQFSFTPTTVDVGSGPQTATFTLRITDDLSGFNNGWLLIASPSGQQSLTETISVNKLISGDTLDGIYEFPMTFPQFSETGLWCVTSMFLKDDTNNMGRPDLSLLECVEVISTTQDTDGDGIPDDEDGCPNSDLSDTVVIDGCDSGVDNVLLGDGCTISDLISQYAEDAKNHGKFVSGVSHMTNDLKKEGEISGKDKGKIQSCASGANLP